MGSEHDFVNVYASTEGLERGEPDAAVCVGCGAGREP